MYISLITLSTTSDNNKDNQKDADRIAKSLNKEIEEIFHDLKNPLVPIRAYGLDKLTKIISRNTNEIKEVLPMLNDIISTMLLDTDTYVYLGAINALTVMGYYYIDEVLKLLLPQFTDRNKPILIRLKIGEAISKVIQKKGEGIVKYKSLLLDTYIHLLSSNGIAGYKIQNTIKDSDESFEMINFRSSCLSTVGDICELCKWSIDMYLNDIIDICKGILEFERNNDDLIRISSVFLLYKLVNGMKEYIFINFC